MAKKVMPKEVENPISQSFVSRFIQKSPPFYLEYGPGRSGLNTEAPQTFPENVFYPLTNPLPKFIITIEQSLI